MAGDQKAFTNWMGDGNTSVQTAPPLLGPSPSFRNLKDAQLAAWGRTPEAQYPDGYLGTQPSTSRRDDKLLNAVHRTNTRPYTRGVHKGERINPGDYVWPDEFNPMSGVENQLTGMRYPTGTIGAEPVLLTNDGKAGPRGIPRELDRPQEEVIDMQRRSMMSRLLPQWR